MPCSYLHLSPHSCWLRLDTYFIWSFIGPATLIIMVSTPPPPLINPTHPAALFLNGPPRSVSCPSFSPPCGACAPPPGTEKQMGVAGNVSHSVTSPQRMVGALFGRWGERRRAVNWLRGARLICAAVMIDFLPNDPPPLFVPALRTCLRLSNQDSSFSYETKKKHIY